MKISRIKIIISDNNKTFYNYSSNERESIYLRIIIFIAISLFLSFLFSGISNDFINTIITVQSILIGFSFSVLFYLVSKKNDVTPHESIEKKLKTEKLKTIENELFTNISYYNIISIACLSVGILLILPNINKNYISNIISYIQSEHYYTIVTISKILIKIINYTFITVFYFLIIESIFTFMRIVEKVHYLFEKTKK